MKVVVICENCGYKNTVGKSTRTYKFDGKEYYSKPCSLCKWEALEKPKKTK